MADILVCSSVRDMMEHPNWKGIGSPLKMFRAQLDELRKRHSMRVCIVENDSVDGTKEFLAEWDGVEVLSDDTGGPVYRSLPADTSQDRLRWYATLKNKALEQLKDEKWVLWVEPDILYPTDLLGSLLSGQGDIRSGLSFSQYHDLTSFYDPLSTRDLHGNKFSWAWPPANTELDRAKCIRGIPFEVSSTFNCFCLINADVVRAGVQFSGDIRGHSEASAFCLQAREKGFSVFLHPSVKLSVYHPLNLEGWK